MRWQVYVCDGPPRPQVESCQHLLPFGVWDVLCAGKVVLYLTYRTIEDTGAGTVFSHKVQQVYERPGGREQRGEVSFCILSRMSHILD